MFAGRAWIHALMSRYGSATMTAWASSLEGMPAAFAKRLQLELNDSKAAMYSKPSARFFVPLIAPQVTSKCGQGGRLVLMLPSLSGSDGWIPFLTFRELGTEGFVLFSGCASIWPSRLGSTPKNHAMLPSAMSVMSALMSNDWKPGFIVGTIVCMKLSVSRP